MLVKTEYNTNALKNALTNSCVATARRLDRRQLLRAVLAGSFVPTIFSNEIALAKTQHDQTPLIMLDPGHGGRDPGAVGVTGLFEKHIALTTAQALKTAFEQNGRYKVMLTRDDDIFIPLEQRTAYAKAHGARLFVSLHADALTDHSVRGASVYTLSARASDAQSEELAHRENSVDPAAAREYADYSSEVASILESLAQRETHAFSTRLQQDVVRALSGRVQMLGHPSRQANFVVLRSREIPSILVEMGFMSNETDELLLQKAEHRQQIVASLQRGIETCMNSLAASTPAG